MTEYKYVTGEVASHGAAIVNRSKTKLYVNESSRHWVQATSAVEKECERVDDHVWYKTQGRILLWEKYFSQSENLNKLQFWEELLHDMSDFDRLDIHKLMHVGLRASLMDCLSHYVNSNCILLPMIGSRQPDCPAWHSNVKPKVTGYPYDDLYGAYHEKTTSHDRRRRSEARFNLVFTSARVPDYGAYTPKFDELLSDTIEELTPDHEKSELTKILDSIAKKCCDETGREPFTTKRYRERAVKQYLVTGAYSAQTEVALRFDPKLRMQNYIVEKLKESGIVHKEIWVEEISDWIATLPGRAIDVKYYDICRLFSWMSPEGLADRRPEDLRRSHFVRSRGEADLRMTFFEYLKDADHARHSKSRIVRTLVDFFAHCSDRKSDDAGHVIVSPLKESDKKRFADTSAAGRGKSNKPVLPRRIVEMAKDILLEDDYAFAKKIDNQYVKMPNESGGDTLFVPTISNLIFLILSIPIRTAQAMMLDSGEADEFVVSAKGELSRNAHPLAKKGRRLGYARRFSDSDNGAQFCGIFVNTNKENALEQKGYEIPYHDARLMRVLTLQREFQEEFNPTDFMIDRSQIGAKDLRYGGINAEMLPKYTFLFRDIRKGAQRWDVLGKNMVADFWLLLLKEVQDRLAEEGVSVQLVWENDIGKLRTEFTLHSLRVSNITHFIEAGVPLHVLAEFLSGHQTLVMTLYYTKLGPRKINEIIAEASKNLIEADEDEFFDRLTELSTELLSEQVVGKEDGLARLPGGDPGLWHVDVDGFCTAGKAMCREGLERHDPETGKVRYEPINPDGFNCALCRFHVTGPAFLAGQVTVANTLLFSIRDRSEQQDMLFRRVTEARRKGNNRAARRGQDQLDKVELELEERIASLGARISNIYASLNLMDKQDETGSERTALITRLEAPEIKARLSEATNFEGIEWASQAVEFFPQLPDSGARFRKGILLEKMAQQNGLKPLLLHLSDDEMHRAGNRLTAMMTELYGEKGTDDLVSGKAKLEEVGGLGKFQALVGEAIKLGGSDTVSISDNRIMIGAYDERQE